MCPVLMQSVLCRRNIYGFGIVFAFFRSYLFVYKLIKRQIALKLSLEHFLSNMNQCSVLKLDSGSIFSLSRGVSFHVIIAT